MLFTLVEIKLQLLLSVSFKILTSGFLTTMAALGHEALSGISLSTTTLLTKEQISN